MIFFLRNISIRLWLSTAIGIPMTLLLFPDIQKLMPVLNLQPGLFALFIVTILFFVTGFLMNITGRATILRQIREAGKWERAGLFQKSRACYLKAFDAFDSCLISILHSKKTAQILTGAVARFYLTFTCDDAHLNRAAISFLHKNPDKTELALLWLKKRFDLKHPSPPNHQEDRLITRFAEEVTVEDQELVHHLAELFIIMERADFAARRVFALALENRQQYSEAMTKEIDNLIATVTANGAVQGNGGRKDNKPTPSPHIYDEIPQDPDNLKQKLLDKGETATQGEVNIQTLYTEHSQPSFSTTRLKSMGTGSKKPKVFLPLKALQWIVCLPVKALDILRQTLVITLGIIIYSLKFTIRFTKKLFQTLSNNDSTRKFIKWIIIAAVMAGLIVFITNTVTHLSQQQAPAVPPQVTTTTEEPEAVPLPPMRFTIQASAHLRKERAEEFLGRLNKKAITAWISTTEGGGKIWYLIRIGQFSTKADAANYGTKLKQQGIINDYFVDNLDSEEK